MSFQHRDVILLLNHLSLILTLYGIWIWYFLLIWKWFSWTARVSKAQDTFSNIRVSSWVFSMWCLKIWWLIFWALFVSVTTTHFSLYLFSPSSLLSLSWSTLILFPEVSPQCGSLTFGKFMGLGFSTPSVHLPPRPLVVESAKPLKVSAALLKVALAAFQRIPVGYFKGLLFPVASLFLLPRCCLCLSLMVG